MYLPVRMKDILEAGDRSAAGPTARRAALRLSEFVSSGYITDLWRIKGKNQKSVDTRGTV